MFSVVVPLYNKRFEIISTLESILKNGDLVHEVIVVDNNSTDGSLSVLEEWCHRGGEGRSKVVLLSETKQGVTHARLRGCVSAQTEWVAFCDADDLWYPSHLEELQTLVLKYKEVKVISSAYIIEEQSLRNIHTKEHLLISNDELWFKTYFFNRSMICSSSVAIRKTFIQKHNFNHNLKIGEDLWYWFNQVAETQCAFQLKRPTVEIRKDIISNRSDFSQDNFQFYNESLNELLSKKHHGFWSLMVYRRRIFVLRHVLGLRKVYWVDIVMVFLELLRRLRCLV